MGVRGHAPPENFLKKRIRDKLKMHFPRLQLGKTRTKISQHVALLLNLGVFKKLSAGFGAIAPLVPPLATALDIVLPLPFVLLRTEINKFISFVLHRKMCITELYKQFNRSLIILVVHRNCLSVRFFCFFPALTAIFFAYMKTKYRDLQ